MSAEFQGSGATGQNLYVLLRNSGGQIYNKLGAAFEAYNASQYLRYANTVTEQGDTGYYVGSMPGGVGAGIYSTQFMIRAGADPDVTDVQADIGLRYVAYLTAPTTNNLDGTDCEFLIDTPIQLGADTVLTLTPFGTTDTADDWAYTLLVSSTRQGPAIESLTLAGPSFALSQAAGVFTATYTATQLDPATEPLLHSGTFWIALWRTDAGFVHCITSGPVSVVRLPGLPVVP